VAEREVLVVKGALGAMGAGNTSVLMQLLVGMLDATLARQQDMVLDEQRVAVALKVDEAPLVLSRGFAETMALKRSAGLETVACWQSDAQWTDREVRDQLDALFAHRVYFATASAREARDAVTLTMPEFSDTVRPGIEHLPKLARPDARLHLPKHHAIASWTTAAGRQAPFIASTIPLRVDRQRIAEHTRRQHERGGRHLTDLRQPHWQSSDNGARKQSDGVGDARPPQHDPPSPQLPEPQPDGADRRHVLPDHPCESYRELAELDLARHVRWATRPQLPCALDPDPLDLAMLELVAELRHVLSSQLHRHFNHARAVTTTQRRLKRLSDAGLLERFQFHRRDGGGVPMCYVLGERGYAALSAAGRTVGQDGYADVDGGRPARRHETGEQYLRQARHDVHVAGWVLALHGVPAGSRCPLRGPQQAVLSPPTRSTPAGPVTIGPSDLRLPGGCVAHDFLRSDGSGGDLDVERFQTIRPDAIVELAPGAVDLLVELDDRLCGGRGTAKLERYDHFLAGWSVHTRRYGTRQQAEPLAVFVCGSRHRARECAQHADCTMRACRAYAGEYPFDWQYPGRERVLFVAERDLHEGLRRAYGIPRLPPSVRVVQARGDPQAGRACVQARVLPAAAG
jgi:hypothetical protein